MGCLPGSVFWYPQQGPDRICRQGGEYWSTSPQQSQSSDPACGTRSWPSIVWRASEESLGRSWVLIMAPSAVAKDSRSGGVYTFLGGGWRVHAGEANARGTSAPRRDPAWVPVFCRASCTLERNCVPSFHNPLKKKKKKDPLGEILSLFLAFKDPRASPFSLMLPVPPRL